MSSFGERLSAAFEAAGRLCIGIDPHRYLLEEWGLADDAPGAREFGLRVVDAAAGAAGIVKPQVAFFERFGSAGYLALERVLVEARDAGLVVIADVKRGDVGSSVAAYGEAWLTVGSSLEVDAMTASAFQGVGSLREPMRLAVASGKGLFVLAATSNPESWPLQRARLIDDDGHRSVSRAIIDDVTAFDRAVQADGVAPIGLVLGATVPFDAYGIDIAQAPTPALPVLAPGFGHQGAALGDARDRFGAWSAAMIVSESRSVLAAGPGGIRDAVRRRAGEVQDALG